MELLKRKIESEVWEHIFKKEITLIIGPRQAGKTTLLKLIEKRLKDQNISTVFFNLDIERHKEYFESQDVFLRKIRMEIPRQDGVVFIDEFQRKENAGLFLKGIFDMETGYKFVVTGSGSLELKESIFESLAGRKRVFELYPLSFEEFLNYQTGYNYEERLQEYCSIEKESVRGMINDYLRYGGYPRVVLEKDSDEKRLIMDEIYRSYLEKDIVHLLNIERSDAFSRLMKLTAIHSGFPIQYSSLASDSGLSVPTVKKYLWYAERTFIINLISPYFSNKRKEITKAPVVYYTDIGMRNYSLGIFGEELRPQECGTLFQNFIYLLLKDYCKHKGWSIHYWRTTDKSEVDFVVDKKTDVLPVEVKYKSLRKPTVSRAFRSFIEKYQPREGWIVNLDYEGEMEIEGTRVRFKMGISDQ